MAKPPIVYSVPHASRILGPYTDRCDLTSDQLFRFSDYGTELTVPRHADIIQAPFSRALGSLNQDKNSAKKFPEFDFARPNPHPVWKEGEELTDTEKKLLLTTIHNPYHEAIDAAINSLKRDCVLIDWHNTAHYTIGQDDHGVEQMMKPIILSNCGNQDSASGTNATCDPGLLTLVGIHLAKELQANNLPHDVYFNHVYKGGYIIQSHNSFTHPDAYAHTVHAFQVEYDTLITHDQDTLQAHHDVINSFRDACTRAIETAVSDYFS